MINNIAYFPLQAAKNSTPVMEAFLVSLKAHGIRAVENSLDADAAVIWSVLWAGKMAKNREVYQHYRQQNRPVIVIDIGALYRGTTWKIAVNNITAEGHYGHDQDLDWDRPRKLGISLADVMCPQPHVIIAAQHQSSLQVQGIGSMEQWVNQQVQQLRSFTDRPVVIRPHPRSRLDQSLLLSGIEIQHPHHITGTYDSFDMHFDCHAVINHNSGPGIQAAIAGVRPVVDNTSLASPVSISIQDIEKPYKVDRDQWLTEICHTEYTLEEIRKGRWIKRLERFL